METGNQTCGRLLQRAERQAAGRKPHQKWCGQPGVLATMAMGQRRHTFVMCPECQDRFRATGWTVLVAT